jgi:chromate transporter
VAAIFAGVAPAVLVIVAQAVTRVGRKALGHPAFVGLAVASFAALTLLSVPFPVVVLLAGIVGWALGRWAPGTMRPPAAGGPGADEGPEPLISDDALHHGTPSGAHAVRVVLLGLLAWGVPVGLVVALTGGPGTSTLTDQAFFFSGAALVTFGGAYAVLAYVAQQAVEVYGWLAPGEMVRGLALAESTPGPLIMVVQFVAFLGAYRDPGSLDPWVAATLAALLTTWVTFVPCFVFIFLGAPYVERLRGNRALSSALAGITAAVVGVIANLAVYFAIHTLFDDSTEVGLGPVGLEVPLLGTLRPVETAITVVAAVLLTRRGWSVLRTLGACALLGLAAGLLGLPVG